MIRAVARRPQPRVPARRFASGPASRQTPFAVTLELPSSANKNAVLDEVSKQTEAVQRGQDALLVLASGEFGSWIEDHGFMSRLVASFARDASRTTAPRVSVLAGVVAGLCPQHVLGRPRQGLSLLAGMSSTLMPDVLTSQGLKQPRPPRSRDAELQSSITFRLASASKSPSSWEVTMPLANTTFINNRQSTLLATQWSRDSSSEFQLDRTLDKQTQTVLLDSHGNAEASADHVAKVIVPLTPLTPSRKVTAGWENILRQVEVDGKEVPASTELEAAVERVFAQQQSNSAGGELKPIPVWAMVIPPGVKPPVANEISVEDWLRKGCRFHRLLSGGGGWGAKRGLLSLDPETRYIPPEDDSVDRFHRALAQRMDGDPAASSQDGIVTPGAFVQFFIAADERHGSAEHNLAHKYAFGTTPWGFAETGSDQEQVPARDIVVRRNRFGGLSTHGLFVTSGSDTGQGSSGAMYSKIDCPQSYVLGSL